MVCGTLLSGPGAVVLRLVGIARSRGNPNLCTRCNTHVESGRILEVTVLFADLSGFTALTHELGPERAHVVVDAFLTRASQAIVSHDGYVDKFIGDAVMAVFNAPIPRPDHAAEAFRSAVEIQAAMPGLSLALGRPLEATVGIARGYARVGASGGRGASDHTLLGDVVNLAARLQSAARPGDIVVDEGIYLALAGEGGPAADEALHLKGFPAPVVCHRFGSRTTDPTPSAIRPRVSPPSLGVGAVALALLGAPCAAVVAVTPAAVWLGVISVATAGGAASSGFLDRGWVRVPLVVAAALMALVNLAAVHHASRLRREREHDARSGRSFSRWRRSPSSSRNGWRIRGSIRRGEYRNGQSGQRGASRRGAGR